MSYLYYYTNYAAYLTGSSFAYTYKQMTGVVCTCDIGGNIASASLTISTGYLPSKWGVSLPGNGAISRNDGSLVYKAGNIQPIGVNLTITGITFPTVGPSMINAVGVWSIPLAVGLDSSVLITIKGNPTNTNLPFTFTGTCAVYYLSLKQRIGCNFVQSPT